MKVKIIVGYSLKSDFPSNGNIRNYFPNVEIE